MRGMSFLCGQTDGQKLGLDYGRVCIPMGGLPGGLLTWWLEGAIK